MESAEGTGEVFQANLGNSNINVELEEINGSHPRQEHGEDPSCDDLSSYEDEREEDKEQDDFDFYEFEEDAFVIAPPPTQLGDYVERGWYADEATLDALSRGVRMRRLPLLSTKTRPFQKAPRRKQAAHEYVRNFQPRQSKLSEVQTVDCTSHQDMRSSQAAGEWLRGASGVLKSVPWTVVITGIAAAAHEHQYCDVPNSRFYSLD